MATKAELKAYFETGDRPQSSQYNELIDETYNYETWTEWVDLGGISSGGLINIVQDYLSASPIQLTNVTDIILDGNGNTIQLIAGAHDYILSIGTGCERITIRNFIFLGEDTGTFDAANEHVGIIIDGATAPEIVTIENCTFKGFDSHAIDVVKTGATLKTLGVTIDKCVFYDCQYDSGAASPQSAIELQDDGEFVTITNSRFYNVPTAIRGSSANVVIDNNVITECIGGAVTGALPTTKGMIFLTNGTTSGKSIITNNRIYNNLVNVYGLYISGESAAPQNIFQLANNSIMENTANDVNGGGQAYFVDCDNLVIVGDTYGCHNTTAASTPVVKITDSVNVRVSGCFFFDADYGLEISETSGDKCSVTVRDCNFDSHDSGYITTSGTGTPTLILPDSFIVPASDEDTDLIVDTGVFTFPMTFPFYLIDLIATVKTAPTGAAIQVDVNDDAATILSTKLTIDTAEKTSVTAATPVVLSANEIAAGSEMTIDIDVVGSGTAGKALKIAFIGIFKKT